MPQKAAGCRIDPPVSEPSETVARLAATAAAEPPLEPPGTRVGSCGLRVGKKPEFSVEDPMANSSQLVFPRITAPAASSLSTAVALYGATKFSSIFDAQVVGRPRVRITSLIATGTPESGRSGWPAAISRSTARACSIAFSSQVERY